MHSIGSHLRLISRGAMRVASVIMLAGAAAMGATALGAAPKAELWAHWAANDPDSTQAIDHAAWDDFLAAYVSRGADGLNRFAYARVSAADKTALGDYIARLAALPISRYSRTEQRAYWANLYNALTVKLILDHYPVKSILDIRISPGLFSVGPWGKKLVTVEGEALSLDDMEHRILRPIWRDPRLHYAVNCASVGCPNLRRHAFTGSGMETALEQAARDYINSARGVELTSRGRLRVSSIYAWYETDFGGSDAGVIRHLRRYAAPALASRLGGVGEIDDDFYDWRLNEAP